MFEPLELVSRKILDIERNVSDISEGDDSGIDDEAASRLNISLILHGQFDGERKFIENLEKDEVADRNKRFFESVKFEN